MLIQRLLSRVEDGTLALQLSPCFNQRQVEVVVMAPNEEAQESPQHPADPDIVDRMQIHEAILPTDQHASDSALLALAAENRELWRRLRLLRDAIRLVDWHHMQYVHPEMGDWFND